MKINILDITAQKLIKGSYQKELPEFYNLKNYIENSLWHLNQSVFDHVVAVYSKAENIISNKSNNIDNYLSKHLGNQTRKAIYLLSVLLHDNAKDVTLVMSETGIAGCPGHELIGATRVWDYQARFKFDSDAMEAVERIVRYHGLISEVINQSLVTHETKKYFRLLQETVGNVLGELILLMYADLLGSDLEKSDKKAFDERIKVLNTFLKWFFDHQQ